MRLIGIVLAAAALSFAGCATTEPINNVVNAPFPLPQGKNLSMTDISKAIVIAATSLGWTMQPVAPGKLNGRLALRTHVAEIDVEHDTTTYTIKYRDSTNLEARDGQIHAEYNRWVANLDKAIRTHLQMAAGA